MPELVLRLTTVLVRSVVDVRNTFDATHVSNLQGPIDKSGFVQVSKLGRVWAPMPDELVPASGMFIKSYQMVLEFDNLREPPNLI